MEEEEEEDFVSLVVVGLVLDSSLAIEVTIFASSAVIMAAMFALEWESKRSYLRCLRNCRDGPCTKQPQTCKRQNAREDDEILSNR